LETWTQSIGLLGHAGFGCNVRKKRSTYVKDRMGNFMAGVTGQIKLTNRIALTGDFHNILNAAQNAAFDGASIRASRGFQGILLTVL
jgi:OOP family OmpA-OmpF porin